MLWMYGMEDRGKETPVGYDLGYITISHCVYLNFFVLNKYLLLQCMS